MERQKFEGSWKDAFDQAEISPSENVWTNVELEIEKSKGAKLKRRLVVFQLLAAASAVFAIGLSIGMYILNQTPNRVADEIAVQQPTQSVETPQSNIAQKDKGVDVSVKDPVNNSETKTSTNDLQKSFKNNDITGSGTEVADMNGVSAATDQPGSASPDGTRKFYAAVLNEGQLPPIVAHKKIELNLIKPAVEEDPVALMLARLNQRELEIKEKQKDKKDKKEDYKNEKLWTTVGLAAGSFSSVNPNAGVSPEAASNRFFVDSRANASNLATKKSIANEQATAPGIAYTIGVAIGTKLAKRWVLQGGVNYLTQSSDYTAEDAVSSADFTSFRPASINEFGTLAEGDVPAEDVLVNTVPYNVNNNLRYLSIPLQAGYLVINRQFGLQLNAGISTDLFLLNTVTASSDNMDKSTRESGEDSPYRPVNLSGLAGTELSYKFGKHYRIAINPGVRYPLNTIYKSEIGVESMPLTFDVGLRLRYIFN